MVVLVTIVTTRTSTRAFDLSFATLSAGFAHYFAAGSRGSCGGRDLIILAGYSWDGHLWLPGVGALRWIAAVVHFPLLAVMVVLARR
jgi:hypothetical protein